MTLGIHKFVQLWNQFTEELKTAKQKIIYTNVTEDFFKKKKNDTELKNMTIVESTESVYDVTSQNLHSVHASYNKNKLKMAAKEWTDDKVFQFRNNLLWIGLGGKYFLWAKAFQGKEQSFLQSKHCPNDVQMRGLFTQNFIPCVRHSYLSILPDDNTDIFASSLLI